MNNLRYLANLEIALALAGWAVGLWGIWRGEETILQYLYFFAWYPYIACLDGLLFRLRGQSWLLTQPRKFLRMFGWSVTVWLIFEAHNLVLKNWGYVAVVPDGWVRWAGYALAFATVLPGVLLNRPGHRRPGGLERPQGPALQPGSLAAAVPADRRRLADPAPGLPPLRLPPDLGGLVLPAGPLLRPFGRGLPHRPLRWPGSAGSISACWPRA